MQYRKQSYNACFAYALWQIGAVSEEAVRVYEERKSFESFELLRNWIKEFAPEMKRAGYLRIIVLSGSHNLKGKGVIALFARAEYYSHAISYEDGIVLDPDLPEERLSLEEYLLRHPQWEVIKILPAKGED